MVMLRPAVSAVARGTVARGPARFAGPTVCIAVRLVSFTGRRALFIAGRRAFLVAGKRAFLITWRWAAELALRRALLGTRTIAVATVVAIAVPGGEVVGYQQRQRDERAAEKEGHGRNPLNLWGVQGLGFRVQGSGFKV